MNRKLSSAVIIMVTLGFTTGIGLSQTYAWISPDVNATKKAPVAIAGDNVYVAWFTDKGMPNSNGEVIFRASQDGGETFGDKINLSNTTGTDSIDAEVNADAETVAVTWWERSNKTNMPVMRISTDSGVSFGPLLELDVNGTIGTGEAKPLGQ